MGTGDVAAVARRADPFVGRGPQVAALEAARAQAQAGAGRVVMLVGEAGIGKTRTAAELAATARRDGALVLQGACYEGEWAPPYAPFVAALTAYVRDADLTLLEADLGFGAGPIARIVPAVRARMPTVPEPIPVQPDEERFRLFDAVSQLLIAVAARQPLVLLIDDLHWSDGGTLALLRHVAHFVPKHPVLLLGTYRDVEVDPAHPLAELLGALRRESSYERIRLERLEDVDAAALVTGLATEPVAAELVTGITTHAEGNPFFLREMVQHLTEENLLRQARLPSFPDLTLSEGIRYLIGRRLARVSADTGRLLTVGAAFAGPFYFDVAAAVADLEHEAALAAIDEGLRARIIHPTLHADRYDFTHALIRQALYDGVNPSRRVRLHRRLAETIETVFAANVVDHAGEIAHQYYRSKDLPGSETGASHALAAADRAEAAYAHEEVARLIPLALELLAEDDRRRPRLAGRLATALVWNLSFADAVLAARDASKRIAESEGPAAAASFLADTAWSISTAGHTPGAWALAADGLALVGARRDATWASLTFFDLLRQAAEDAGELGIPPDSAPRDELGHLAHRVGLPAGRRWLLMGHGICPLFASRDALIAGRTDDPTLLTFWAGDYRRSRQLWQTNAVAAEETGRLAFAVECWAQLSRVLTAIGELPAARDAYERGVSIARRFTTVSRQSLQLIAARFEAVLAADEGWKEFLREQQDLAGSLQPENGFGLTAIQAAAAGICAKLGRADDAILLVGAALPALERVPGWLGNYSQIACDAAEVLWTINRSDHAAIIERVVREKVVAPDFRYPMRDARLAVARVCALSGNYDAAREWFTAARIVLDEQGARPLRAIADYDEGLMYMRRGDGGDRSRAAPLLEASLVQLRALGMPGWIRRAEHLLEHGREWAREKRQEQQERPADRVAHEAHHRPPKLDTNVFRRSGDMWTITFKGTTVQLRDTRGLQYLARVLAQPLRELHATEVIGARVAPASPRAASDAETVAADLGDAGAVLDAIATAQYQRRLTDLREDLAEAETNNDLGRAAQLREELTFLCDQLAGAGRGRRAASHAERARVTVAKGIAAAMKKIAAAHPALGRHLKATIRTGYFCSYSPDPRVEWDP